MEQERSSADLRRINASLTAQIQIVCEKEQALKDRASSAERERRALADRARALEAFRRRVLRWVRPRFKRAARAEASLYAREAELAGIKSRLLAAQDRARDLEGNGARDQAMLVDGYETQLSEARAEAEKLRSERAYLKERSDRLEESRRLLAEAENHVILRDRQKVELERKLNDDVGFLQREMASYRREAKRLAAEVGLAKQGEERAEAQRAELSHQLARSEDQFESLRALWDDAQQKCDALRGRNDVLARVNQELARKLREDRGLDYGSSLALESGSFAAPDNRIVSAATIASNASAEARSSAALDGTDSAAATEAARGQGFDRINVVLAEIESGFSRRAPMDGKNAATLEPSTSGASAAMQKARALRFAGEGSEAKREEQESQGENEEKQRAAADEPPPLAPGA
jgi:chromosome segregation ATPase